MGLLVAASAEAVAGESKFDGYELPLGATHCGAILCGRGNSLREGMTDVFGVFDCVTGSTVSREGEGVWCEAVAGVEGEAR